MIEKFKDIKEKDNKKDLVDNDFLEIIKTKEGINNALDTLKCKNGIIYSAKSINAVSIMNEEYDYGRQHTI